MSDKVEFDFTLEDLQQNFIKKLNSLQQTRNEPKKPGASLGSPLQGLRAKMANMGREKKV